MIYQRYTSLQLFFGLSLYRSETLKYKAGRTPPNFLAVFFPSLVGTLSCHILEARCAGAQQQVGACKLSSPTAQTHTT